MEDQFEVLQEYIKFCELQRKSENTIHQYLAHVEEFLKFMKERRSLKALSEIAKVDVYNYLHYIAKEKKNSISTQRSKIASIKHFYIFLIEFNIVDVNVAKDIDLPKLNPPVRRYLTLEQVSKIVSSVNSRNKTRDQTILMLFLTTGLRLSELVNLNVNDIKTNYLIINGKGDKERVVYLTENMRHQLQNYLLTRPDIETDALFISERGNRIAPNTVRYVVEQALKGANLDMDTEGISVHTLRHTYATINYQSGNMDIRELQEALGHSNLNTTQIYVQTSEEKLKSKAEKNPLNNILF